MKKTILAALLASLGLITAPAFANGNGNNPSNPGTTTTTASVGLAGDAGGYVTTVGGNVSSSINSNLNVGSYVSGSGESYENASSNLAGAAGISATYSPTGVTVSTATSQSGTSEAYGHVSGNQPGIETNGDTTTIYNGAITGGSVTNVANIQTNTFQSAGIGGVIDIAGIGSIGTVTTPSGTNSGGNDNGQGNNGHDNGNH